MKRFTQKQVRAEVLLRMGSTGSTYRIVKELEAIAQDTSPDIRQVCVSYHDKYGVFYSRVRMANDAEFGQLLKELHEFEQSGAAVKERHTAIVNGLIRTSLSLWRGLESLQGDINKHITRIPRIEYDASEIVNLIGPVLDAYPADQESYTSLLAFIERVKPVFIGAKKVKADLDKRWQEFITAQDNVTETLQKMLRLLDRYREMGRPSWVWIQREYDKAFLPVRWSFQKLDREREQLRRMDITIEQAIERCQLIEAAATVELHKAIAKLERIHDRQAHLQQKLRELKDDSRRKTLLHLRPKDVDLIDQLCALCVRAENEYSAKMYLDIAQKILEEKLSREEAIQVINAESHYIQIQQSRNDSVVIKGERNLYRESGVQAEDEAPRTSTSKWESLVEKSEQSARQFERGTAATAGDVSAEEVAFTAFHPKEGKVETWHTLLVYTHVASALASVQDDANRFSDQIVPRKQITEQALTQIFRGVKVTIVPLCKGVRFNPPDVDFEWSEDFHRADFRFIADRSLADDAAKGQIDIYAGPFIVGCLRFVMLLTDKDSSHKLDCEEHAKMYSKDDVFISYSRKDLEVVRPFKNVLEASGLRVFLDLDSIGTGQYWQEETMRRIERAKIFQIFWSPNYCESENCRLEWQHALKQNREEGYIRPVFWKNPLAPKPPTELIKFNFKYVELRLPRSYM